MPPKKDTKQPEKAANTNGHSAKALPTVEDVLEYESPEDKPPRSWSLLYDDDKVNLARITETPRELVFPMAMVETIAEAMNPNRKEPLLINVLINKLDNRMIGMDRQGRHEAVELLQAEQRLKEMEEEEAIG